MTTPARRIEPTGRVRTKIVATIGPASRDRAVIRAMVDAGADLFRLNFSHGTWDEHTEALATIRAVAEETGAMIAVLQDLAGPKIRLGELPGDAVECALDDMFTLAPERTSDDPHQLTCSHCDLTRDLVAGDLVLFADGAVAMEVVATEKDGVRLKVTLPGRLKSRQGINIPGETRNIPALTEKDLHDLDWTAAHGVEYVGLSFVRQASDVAWLRAELDRRGSRARIVAKIEKPQAVSGLDPIMRHADAVMVARGDLGVEMDVARVPAVQKQIITACHRARVPVITATQMLNSMESSNRPTRAEASDVFNAVLDGTDAVMLSGETAIGAYPVDAVATMSRIAAEAESLLFGRPEMVFAEPSRAEEVLGGHGGWVEPITESIVEAGSLTSRRAGAALLVVTTQSGRTALALSKHRNPAPTLALADDLTLARAMALYWGVTPLHCPASRNPEQGLAFALDWARARSLVKPGDRVVLIQGTVPGVPTHNALFVHVVSPPSS